MLISAPILRLEKASDTGMQIYIRLAVSYLQGKYSFGGTIVQANLLKGGLLHEKAEKWTEVVLSDAEYSGLFQIREKLPPSTFPH
jgi:hypothetical protein